MAEATGRSHMPGNDVVYHPIHLHNFPKPELLQLGKTRVQAKKAGKVAGQKMPGWESEKFTLAAKGKKGKKGEKYYPESR